LLLLIFQASEFLKAIGIKQTFHQIYNEQYGQLDVCKMLHSQDNLPTDMYEKS
jgi:hypothetical protein